MAQSSNSIVASSKRDRLARLQAEYQAVSRQLEVESSPRIRVQLEGQLRQLEEEMAALEDQLRRLEQEPEAGPRAEPTADTAAEPRPLPMNTRWLLIAAIVIAAGIIGILIAVTGNEEPWEKPPETTASTVPTQAPTDAPAPTPGITATADPAPGGRAVLADISLLTSPIEMEFVRVPAGEFLMGSDPAEDPLADDNEQPQHSLFLDEFHIGRYEVTNRQYAAFVQDTGHPAPEYWGGGAFPPGKEQHPVVEVSWHDAVAFTAWLSAETGQSFRLCSEAEWEKAARSSDGRIYPWGNEFDVNKANVGDIVGTTRPVGAYSPGGDSPYGVADMTGNVWEWTSSLWGNDWRQPGFRYPYDPADGREDLETDGLRVTRGGAFHNVEFWVRNASRGGGYRSAARPYSGFRVCASSLTNPAGT